jgi:chromatin remodeling complex protein RSC6
MTDSNSPSISELFEMQFKNVFDELSSIGKRTRELQDNFKVLHKTVKNAERLSKHKKKKVPVPMTLSSELEKFLSVNQGTKMTKAEVMKGVSEYIKTNNLQLEDNKRKFLPNKNLKKVFKNMTSNQPLTFVEINKHVSYHLSK